MLTAVNPKLPMRNKQVTREFYVNKLGFTQAGGDFDGYLMVQKDNIELHFFEFSALDPKQNYGQIYIRTNDIDIFYSFVKEKGLVYTPLEHKPWGQHEFAMLDPDNNLITVGQHVS